MLAEFLADQGDWTSVMPSARACLFSLDERPGPLPLQLEHLHFETLFCLRGSVTLTRQDGSFLKACAQQVLLLTDLADFTGANVDAPLEGVLVAVDARGARESLERICNLLGGLTLDTGRVRRWMASQERPRGSRPHALEPGSLCRPGQPSPKRAGTLVRVEVGGTALSALHPGGTGEGCTPKPDAGPEPCPATGGDTPIYGRAPGRASHHPRLEPPGVSLCHHV